MAVILTVVGQNKFAAALAGGDPVDFNTCEFAVGDGGGDFYVLDEEQTSLVNEVWRDDVNRGYVDPTNLDQVIAEAFIPAGVGGWTIREAGLFDADGDLIAVGIYPLTEKPAPGSGSEKQIYVRMVMQVTNGGSAIVEVTGDMVVATQEYVDNHAALTDAHGATSAATASRLMIRDAAGRVQVAAPDADADVARKAEVDAEATARSSADTSHANLTSPHSATSAATASRLMVRDTAGRAQVAAPSADADIARKAEVDAEATARNAADGTLQTNIDSEATARSNADTSHANLTDPHSATSAATASRLMIRDAAGRVKVNDPAEADDAATLQSVLDNANPMALIACVPIGALVASLTGDTAWTDIVQLRIYIPSTGLEISAQVRVAGQSAGPAYIRLSCGGENGSTSEDVSGAYTWRSLSIDVSGLSAGWYDFAIQWRGQSATTLTINGVSIRQG